MPELFHIDEKHGCGATIKLDNGDHCLVSVGQSGVIVRSYQPNIFLKAAPGSFFGPILFEERNLYEAVKIAIVLDSEYPDITGMSEFRNPVLYAFVKAIWSCASAAQVCVILKVAKRSANRINAVDVTRLLEKQRFKTRKSPAKLQVASYDVFYSDGRTHVRDLMREEIQSWAEESNHMLQTNGLPYRILRIVGKDGTVVWPPA